jgi:hypothetical protein
MTSLSDADPTTSLLVAHWARVSRLPAPAGSTFEGEIQEGDR